MPSADSKTNCPTCGFADEGAYCSNCGSLLNAKTSTVSMLAEAVSAPDGGFIRKFIHSITSAAISPAKYTLAWSAGNRRDYLSPVAVFVALFALVNALMFALGVGAPNPNVDIESILALLKLDVLAPQLADARADPAYYVRKLQFIGQIWPSMTPVLFTIGAVVALAGIRGWSIVNSVTLGLVEGMFQMFVLSIGALDDLVLGNGFGPLFWWMSGLLLSIGHGAWHIVSAAKVGVLQGVLRALASGFVALLALVLFAWLSALAALFPLPFVK